MALPPLFGAVQIASNSLSAGVMLRPVAWPGAVWSVTTVTLYVRAS